MHMNMKKIIATAACLVMACVFATTAFAKTAAEKRADAQAYLNAQGISYDLSAVTDEQINALSGQKAELQAKADNLIAALRANPGQAEALANDAVAFVNSKGISVTAPSITVGSDGTVVVTATVNGATATAKVSAQVGGDSHPDIGEAIANGTWGVDSTTSAAASAMTSSGSVIKATGDSNGMMLVAALLAVSGVLGLAVRKSSSIA